ncbi:MAG: LptF/LptG family permease [Flavobacteriales bacterium]|jgi:lipopolysaccharide export system permease protein|nr:LptF/LptG family permease [Flavobacteriales bacterium]
MEGYDGSQITREAVIKFNEELIVVLTRLDRYILKQFLGTFFFTIGLMICIVVVFDMSEKIDNFIEHQLTTSQIITEYYIYFIPYFVNLFSPLFIFIAVIMFTSRLAYRSEIVAILSSGISFYRLMVPYMIGCTILAIMSLGLNHFIIPKANEERILFENTYINRPWKFYGRNQHYQIEPGTFIYFDSYSAERMTGYKFAMEKFVDGEMVYKLISDHIVFDTTLQKWSVKKYYERTFDGVKETITKGKQLDTLYSFHPSDFGQRLKVVEAMDYWQLNDFIATEEMRGSDYLSFFKVERERRTSMPFAAFILTIIGVSLGSRKVRGGMGMHLGFGLLISFSYILFMQVSQTFAIEGNMSVRLAVWIPNILYFFLGGFMLYKAPK